MSTKWIYKLYKFRLTYKIDKEAMVAFVDINKPEQYIDGDNRSALQTLVDFFTAAGYCVIVRD